MAKAKTPPSSSKALSNNLDNIAGVGGGMLLVSLAQNLPESNIYKSWLIILAPPLTLGIKWVCNICYPEIVFYIKKFKTQRARKNLISQIDVLLKDTGISDEKKALLLEKREQAILSAVEELSQHLEAISAN